VYWGAGREPKPSDVVWRAMECPRQKVGRNDGVGSYKIEMSSNTLGIVSVQTTRTFAFQSEVPEATSALNCVLLLAGRHSDFEQGSPESLLDFLMSRVVEAFARPSLLCVRRLSVAATDYPGLKIV